MQTKPERRRFHLVDAIVLVAAVAAGLALVRPALAIAPEIALRNLLEAFLYWTLLYGTPVVVTCSLAALLLSLRRPRPRLQRLARSPGFVVPASAMLGVIILGAHYVGYFLLENRMGPGFWEILWIQGLPLNVGFVVLGAVLAMALRGDWRSRGSWVDRLGWVLGGAWITLGIFAWVRVYYALMLPWW